MEAIILFTIVFLVLMIPYLRGTFFAVNNQTVIQITQRLPFFDALRGLAILAVILIHVRRFFEMYNPANDLYFLYAANNLTRFAIPFFLICSGILLNPFKLNKESITDFYLKKILRIFVPYALVSFAIALGTDTLRDLPRLLVTGEASVPFYFMVVLFQCYLVYPLLQFASNKKTLLTGAFFLSLASFFYPDSWYYGSIPMATKFLFFFVYGYVKRDDFISFVPRTKELRGWMIMILIYLALILSFPTLMYNVRLIYGVALFNILFFAKRFILDSGWLSKSLAWIGVLSLWIYLLHYPITEWIYFATQNMSLDYYVLFFLNVVLASMLSIAAAYVANRIYGFISKKLFSTPIRSN